MKSASRKRTDMDRVVLTMQDLRVVRFAETESRMVGARDWGRRGVES